MEMKICWWSKKCYNGIVRDMLVYSFRFFHPSTVSRCVCNVVVAILRGAKNFAIVHPPHSTNESAGRLAMYLTGMPIHSAK